MDDTGVEIGEKSVTLRMNEDQAKQIVDHLTKMLKKGLEPNQVIVMTLAKETQERPTVH